MGLLDKIFDKDDDDVKKADARAAGRPAPLGPTTPPTHPPTPRADFSDVQGASSTTAPAGGQRTYTVKSGDSLSKIAERELGDGSKWRAIYEANRDQIKDPDLIHPGQVLNLPGA